MIKKLIRKMLTASGGPLRKPRIKLNGLWRELNYEGNGDFSTLTENGKMSFTTGKKSPKSIVGNEEIVVTPEQTIVLDKLDNTKNYYSTYNPDDIIKGFNILTLGGLNNLSLSQWARRAYDTGKFLTGNMTLSGLTDSWINGNNGLVSLKFAKEHPNLTLGINGTVDSSILPFLKTPKVSSNLSTSPKSIVNIPSIARIGDATLNMAMPGFIGGMGGIKLGEKIDSYLPEKYQGFSPSIGYILGSGIGTSGAYKIVKNNTSEVPLLHSKYKKLNDIINYPLTTTSVTLLGKYPWTNKLTFKLKRLLFKDIDEARNFLLKSGYLLEDLPSIRIAKHPSEYRSGELGHYTPYLNHVTVKPTINPYSNIPIDVDETIGGGFKGLVNHELTHGRLNFFGGLTEYDPNAGYYVVRKDINTPVLDPFRKKKAGLWTASPDEFDAELSNLLIATGKSPIEPVDNIFPLQKRFNIWNKNKAREIENLILLLRKDLEFFKQGGKMNIIEFLKKGSGIHIKPSKRGSFTRWCGGNVTEECIRRGKNSPNAAIRKKATFADNARHFKHKKGGKAFVEGVNVLDSNPKAYKYVKKAQQGGNINWGQLISGVASSALSTYALNQLLKALKELEVSELKGTFEEMKKLLVSDALEKLNQLRELWKLDYLNGTTLDRSFESNAVYLSLKNNLTNNATTEAKNKYENLKKGIDAKYKSLMTNNWMNFGTNLMLTGMGIAGLYLSNKGTTNAAPSTTTGNSSTTGNSIYKLDSFWEKPYLTPNSTSIM